MTAPFPIVGIGASAGGVEALDGFFHGLPDQPGVAVVVITHLSPDHESRLHEVIANLTMLPVVLAADGMRVEPDHVYVIGVPAVAGVEGGRLRLQPFNGGGRERKPIDVFFASLAVDQGEAAVGVVLSGGDGDGTLGVKAIKEHGGLTIAQAPNGHGPQHPDMPESAIAGGFVDFALPAEQIGPRLADYARGLSLPDGAGLAAPDGAEAAPRDATAEATALAEARREIYAILRNQVGHDFGGYKTRTFLRRVQRRMHIVQVATITAYIERLREDPQEVRALFRDLLIGVTHFFRDADAFESLQRLVVPKLFEGRGATDSVRVWVPGCATGEEVFSIAILLREHMDTLPAVPRVQIFATDIDERALSVARAARYPAALVEGVSPARLERYFVLDGSSYVVGKEVRDLCIFSPHSVIRDPPFSRIDLVSCRNLLIYFGPDVQNQVVPVFHYALRPDGWLFLGTAETIGQFGDLFAPIDKKQRIFRRRGDVSGGIRVPLAVTRLRAGGLLPGGEPRKPAAGGIALRQAVESQVLDHHAPAFVVVNRDGDVAHYSARTGKYLEAAAGMPTRQILTMARKGLRLDLRTALHDAIETGAPATRSDVLVEGDDGRVQAITLKVELLRDSERDEQLYLILFVDEGPPADRQEGPGRGRMPDGATAQLERELRETRDRLQSLIEEYETALEELKAANEELVSVNEELQSTNEELEASKEELVSVNEELHTVNLELGSKVEALDRANTDLRNLFESTDVATVFLDDKLVIRSFTPAVGRVFNVLPTDRGRPITDLASRFSLPDLAEDVATVLASGNPVERQTESAEGGTHYLVRISPYRDGEQRTHGVVVSFVDVTSLTRAEASQRILIAELHHRTRNLLTVVQAIATLTLGKGGSLKGFTDRLAALGRAQDLVNNTGRDELDLAELVALELRAHVPMEDGRVVVSGPPVPLGLDRVQALALAMHELATNATKYGALGQEGGHLEVHWRIEPNGAGASRVVLDWRESGVRMPAGPPKCGYGRQLIERALAHTLGAKAELTFGPDGVSCRIELPLGSRRMRPPPRGSAEGV